MYEFPCPQPVTASITFAAGSCDVVATDTDTATVDIAPYSSNDEQAVAAARVELHGDQLVVDLPPHTRSHWREPRVRIAVRVPTGSSVRAKVASADVTARGELANVVTTTASGKVHVASVTGDADVRTASGDVRVDRVGGSFHCHTASGDVWVGGVGADVVTESASGDVTIEDLGGSAQISTASGDIRLGVTRRGTVSVKTASGDTTVGVAAGTAVWLDLSSLSGRTVSDLAMTDGAPATGAELSLRVAALSGNIDVHRVQAPVGSDAAGRP